VAWGQAPSYSAAGIVNASDYSSAPFAPNSVVSLFGANLSFASEPVVATISGLMLPTELDGVRVLVDGSPAPLLFVSPGQINFLVPSTEIPGNSTVQVVRQSVAGPAVTIALVDAAPALFSSGGYVLAQEPNYFAITPDAPAHSGDTIILYATGLGHTLPNPSPGQVSPTAANTVASPQVLLNGAAIDSTLIKYSGLTPSSTGLYQINFVIPGGFTADAEVRVSAAGQTSAAGLKLAIR
jgi:uncharacterized protein (TIGR03437 family)